MKKSFYVLEMWQTGNVGSHNIRKVIEQPDDGFLLYRDAETWLVDNIKNLGGLWNNYMIQLIYSKV